MSSSRTNRRAPRTRHPDRTLDLVFGALASTTRRHILERLARGPATVGELAEPFRISSPAITRHLKVLEAAGFLTRTVEGRVHSCMLDASPIATMDVWLTQCRQHWEETLDSLEVFAAAAREENPEK